MDDERFDGVIRALGAAASRRAAIGLLVGLATIRADTTAARPRRDRRRTHQGQGRTRPAAAAVAGPGGSPGAGGPGGSPGGGGSGGCGITGCGNACHPCATTTIGPGANLAGCDLAGRDLAGIRLNGANLSQACLECANLTGATLRGTNLTGACLCGAQLQDADLRGAKVSPAQVACAQVTCSTILPTNRPAVVCPPGLRCCAGGCIDVTSDGNHCGRCGHACGADEACCGGRCRRGVCGAAEEFDPVRCTCVSACGPACAADETCRVAPSGGPACCRYSQAAGGCSAQGGDGSAGERGAATGRAAASSQVITCDETCQPLDGSGGRFGQGTHDVIPCAAALPCGHDGECPTGSRCVVSPCCGGGVCAPGCNAGRFPLQ
jgi:hypothetical protein